MASISFCKCSHSYWGFNYSGKIRENLFKKIFLKAISERNTKKEDIAYLIEVNTSLKNRMPQPLSFAHLEITSYNFPATDSYPGLFSW